MQCLTCPMCKATTVHERQVTEWFPYNGVVNAFQISFPAMVCGCGFGWRDARADELINAAAAAYMQIVKQQ